MAAAGVVVVSLIVGLLIYGATSEDPVYEEMEANAYGGGPAETESTVASASLWVDADPAGATVFVDGEAMGAVPLVLDRVAGGEHVIEIIRADGRTVADTTIWIGDNAIVNLDLSGREPLADASDEPRDRPTDSAGLSETIAVAPERPAPAPPRARPSRQPVPTGELRVTSTPAGATVLLDGRRLGTTPLAARGLRAGRHTLSIEQAGYETAQQSVTIHGGGTYEAAIDLRRAEIAEQSPAEQSAAEEAPSAAVETGTVEILVRPWGRIVIDGAVHQEETDVVYRVQLAAGTHRISVSNPQLGSDERLVTVAPGGQTRVEFILSSGEQEPGDDP